MSETNPSAIELAENTLANEIFELAAARPDLFGDAGTEIILCAHDDDFGDQFDALIASNLGRAITVRCGDAQSVRFQAAGADGAIVPVGVIGAQITVFVPFLGADAELASAEAIGEAIIGRIDGAAFERPFLPQPVTLSSTFAGETDVQARIVKHVFTANFSFLLILGDGGNTADENS